MGVLLLLISYAVGFVSGMIIMALCAASGQFRDAEEINV